MVDFARISKMEDRNLQEKRGLSYLPYISICIGLHLFLSLCYCMAVDISEANAIVFLLKPGTISLFFLFIPIRTIKARVMTVFVSILINGRIEVIEFVSRRTNGRLFEQFSIKWSATVLSIPFAVWM